MPISALRPAILLDRDGVILENRDDYVKTLDEARFTPGALAALARLAASGHPIVIVTNQSGIGRGLIAPATAEAISQMLLQRVEAAGGRIDGVYVCPHAPEAGCACRKPAPGLLLAAASALDLDLAESVLIGDAVSDVLAGQAVGARSILVRTGRGAQEALALAATPAGAGVPVVADLAAAVDVALAFLARQAARPTKTPPLEGGVSARASAGIVP